MKSLRVAFVNSHPIQYFAPLYAYLNREEGATTTSLDAPVTVDAGTNVLIGRDAVAIMRAVTNALRGGRRTAPPIECWDGCAAVRVVDGVVRWLRRS